MFDRKTWLAVLAGVIALVGGLTAPAHARPAVAPESTRPVPAQVTADRVAHPLVTSDRALPGAARAAAVHGEPPPMYARAAYLVDATAGEDLYTKQTRRRLPVASLTKVMTAHLVLRQAKLTDLVEIAPQDVRYAEAGGGTTADLRVGDRLSVHDLLYALMLPSGADAAHALARTYGPGVDTFVATMNAEARRLGMADTTYLNADGLPTPDGEGFSTARDQAVLAELALRDPVLAEITATQRHTVGRTAEHAAYTWVNTNKLLGTAGVIGMKTGFTQAAGFCLTFAADRGGHRLVGVILGESVSSRRFSTAADLLDWAVH